MEVATPPEIAPAMEFNRVLVTDATREAEVSERFAYGLPPPLLLLLPPVVVEVRLARAVAVAAMSPRDRGGVE